MCPCSDLEYEYYYKQGYEDGLHFRQSNIDSIPEECRTAYASGFRNGSLFNSLVT